IAERAGEPALCAMADAAYSLGCALDDRAQDAATHHGEAATFLDALPDDMLAPLVGSLSMLASTDLYLGRFADGAARAGRALSVARATEQVTLTPTIAPALAGASDGSGHAVPAIRPRAGLAAVRPGPPGRRRRSTRRCGRGRAAGR